MDSHDDEKTVEVVTSAEVVPDHGKKDSTTDETICACFTRAAAASGLISDGCSLRTVVPKGLHINGLYKGLKFSASWCNHRAAVHRTCATLGTAAHGAHGSSKGLFWFLTFARGLTRISRSFHQHQRGCQ
ncbi:hypothetical protein EDB84DRAFT_1436424 [Lactarius hengduanensis]|nr:hypothetical protein EDB84DRAFT_1436424 [Lactarius hengduanensis]